MSRRQFSPLPPHAKKLPPVKFYSRNATCIYRCHDNLMSCRVPYTGLLVLVFLGMAKYTASIKILGDLSRFSSPSASVKTQNI